MKVVHWGKAKKFFRRHTNAESPLTYWKRSVIAAEWDSFADIKETFNTADWVENFIVFDIGGNKFRLIAICRFELGSLYIQDVLTHDEYVKSKWKGAGKKTKKAK